MRVTIVGKFFPSLNGHSERAGGIETDTLAVANALKDRFDVTVLVHSTNGKGARERWPGFDVIRSATQLVALSQPLSLAHLFRLRRLKPDIIHLHAPNHWASFVIWLTMRGTPLVITHHMEVNGRALLQKLASPFYRSLCRRADAVIVSTRTNRENSRDLPLELKRVEEIPYGLDPERYLIDDSIKLEAAQLRAKLGVTGKVAGTIGRAVPYKGLSVLLDAIRLSPDTSCLIVGDGPLLDELKAQTNRDGTDGRVFFLGRLPGEREKLVALAAMDYFVLPSISIAEAFAIVQVEAQLCGLPVLTSRIPTGVRDVTIDGVTGYHFNPGDAEDLASKMAILEASPQISSAMGAAGKVRAETCFSAAAHANAVEALFASLV